MKKADHYLWLNAMREMLGLDRIPYTEESRTPQDSSEWLADGGSDFSTGEEAFQFPAAQRRHFKRLPIRNMGQ